MAARDRDPRGHRPSPRGSDGPVRQLQAAAARPTGAAPGREVRETLAGAALIVRFAVFVAAILARHHLRRLWPGAARRKSWLRGRGAAPGRSRLQAECGR
jgi:hypothetical protein